MRADEGIAVPGLEPHPQGGHFRETLTALPRKAFELLAIKPLAVRWCHLSDGTYPFQINAIAVQIMKTSGNTKRR